MGCTGSTISIFATSQHQSIGCQNVLSCSLYGTTGEFHWAPWCFTINLSFTVTLQCSFLLQITLTPEHDLIMLIDIPFPVISATQSLIPSRQIFPIGYCDIVVHRSHRTLHFLLFVSLRHTQHATSMSNPTSIKTFTPDARSIFIPCIICGHIIK